jgi:hypothetical protein
LAKTESGRNAKRLSFCSRFNTAKISNSFSPILLLGASASGLPSTLDTDRNSEGGQEKHKHGRGGERMKTGGGESAESSRQAKTGGPIGLSICIFVHPLSSILRHASYFHPPLLLSAILSPYSIRLVTCHIPVLLHPIITQSLFYHNYTLKSCPSHIKKI